MQIPSFLELKQIYPHPYLGLFLVTYPQLYNPVFWILRWRIWPYSDGRSQARPWESGRPLWFAMGSPARRRINNAELKIYVTNNIDLNKKVGKSVPTPESRETACSDSLLYRFQNSARPLQLYMADNLTLSLSLSIYIYIIIDIADSILQWLWKLPTIGLRHIEEKVA